MNRNCILFFALLLSTTCFAQTEDVTSLAKLTFLNPGLGYELRIGKFQTLNAQAFGNLSLTAKEDGFGSANFSFFFDPAATLQYRYYYNNRHRLEREKRTDKNSMNYVALVGEWIYSRMPLNVNHDEELKRRAVNRFGLVWGLQRNFESHFSLDFNIGLGYMSSTRTVYYTTMPTKMNVGQLAFLGQLNLGFWFGGK